MRIKVVQKLIDKIRGKNSNFTINSFGDEVRVFPPYAISETTIGKGTYITKNATISMTTIGKFCSIGPNFMCGWGIHPTNGISTSPYFYSAMNGLDMNSFSLDEKIEIRKPITIGNDVFIGANVTILDGVNIGNGAVIGAGAVVVKDVPPYAIVGGVPAKVIKYRFADEIIDKLSKINWWDFNNAKIKDVEKMFFDVDGFIEKYGEINK